MMLALIALILRPVGFKYRSKMEGTRWRNTWDGVLCFSGVVASLVFGVAVGNIILGVPFTFDEAALRMVYQGHFYQLFTPFALLAGVLSVAMLAMHGAVLLAWRTEGVVASRARWGRLCAADRGAVRGRRFLGRGRAERPRHHQRGRRAGPIRSHAQDRQRAGRRLDGQLRQVAADVDRARAAWPARCWRCCS